MLRKLLLLALMWPSLLPPGYCVCRPAAAPSRAASPAECAEEFAPRCRCCRPKPKPSPATLNQPTEAPVHLPDCPAHPSWRVARAFAPAAEPIDDGRLVEAPFTPLLASHVPLGLPALAASSSLTGDALRACPPLYLLGCALRC